jgi:HlyD family secretion protein
MRKDLWIIGILAVLLTACGASSTPTPIPTISLDDISPAGTAPAAAARGSATASAVVVSARQAEMAFTTGGNVSSVNVTVGDRVQAGDVLLELENTLARLDVEQAERVLRELSSPASIAAAERAVAQAQKDAEDAQDKVYALDYPRASETEIEDIKSDLAAAKQHMALASDNYRRLSNRPDGSSAKDRALDVLIAAEYEVRRLQAEYDWYTGKPTETDAAIVRANLDAANAALQEAEWYLSALKGEQVPPEATGAQLSQLQQARGALEAAQARLDSTRLIAPFPGIVAAVNAAEGDFAPPGQVLLILIDAERWQVETTDLSERQIMSVKIGDSANIRVDALGREFSGRVILISPIANTLGGDVVYRVTIAFDEHPEGLLGGMSATVDILAGD